jgi:ABC-type tungstate transport system permease subunit
MNSSYLPLSALVRMCGANVKQDLGQAFIDWLVSPDGQNAIANYKINGEQMFFPGAADPTREDAFEVNQYWR